jgi:hypothetical protein
LRGCTYSHAGEILFDCEHTNLSINWLAHRLVSLLPISTILPHVAVGTLHFMSRGEVNKMSMKSVFLAVGVTAILPCFVMIKPACFPG